MNLYINKKITLCAYGLLVIIIGMFFFSCDLSIFRGNPSDRTNYPNVLNPKDSLAMRAILDANGMKTVNIRSVIDLQDTAIVSINFNALSLQKFIFSIYFDSLISHPILYLINNEIDTLIFMDTIKNDLVLSLEYNKLRVIPDEIAKLNGTIKLYLSYNVLNAVSPNIMKCNVASINVKYNHLVNIPDSIAKWITRTSGDSAWKNYQTP